MFCLFEKINYFLELVVIIFYPCIGLIIDFLLFNLGMLIYFEDNGLIYFIIT